MTNLFNQIILKDLKHNIGHCKWKIENTHANMKEFIYLSVIMVPTEQIIFCQAGYGKQMFQVRAIGSDFPLKFIYGKVSTMNRLSHTYT